MDFQMRQAADMMKQVGMFAKQALSKSEAAAKEQARFEIRAEIDPKVWTEIASYVDAMLDAGASGGNLPEIVDKMKDFAREQQRQFDAERDLATVAKDRMLDKLELSAAATQPPAVVETP